MNSTQQPATWQQFPALRRSFRRGDSAAAIEEAKTRADYLDARPDPWAVDPSKPFAPLERATMVFRHLQQIQLRAKATAARAQAARIRDVQLFHLSVGAPFAAIRENPRALEASTAGMLDARDEERAELSRARWYDGRAGAQRTRFHSIRTCGDAQLSVACMGCSEALCEPVPCTCGVVRVCRECALDRAAKRQKRIAAARAAALLQAEELGLRHGPRPGGAVGEKMLTLTVPHFALAESRGEIRKACEAYGVHTTIAARIAALRLAWPRFMRALRRWLKGRNLLEAKVLAYYRLLEWTRGDDGQGHPHFHVYMLSRFIPIALLRRWWGAALEKVGCPLPRSCAKCSHVDDGRSSISGDRERDACPFGAGEPHVIVDVRALYGLPSAQLRELVKSGDRRAIELAIGEFRAPDGGGLRAIAYAMGWTMADAFADLDATGGEDTTQARDVYCALEGRRMAQGARGFLLPLPSLRCECCGGDAFVAAIVNPCEVSTDVGSELAADGCRGPPE